MLLPPSRLFGSLPSGFSTIEAVENRINILSSLLSSVQDMASVVVRMYATLRTASGLESVILEARTLAELDSALRRRFGPDMGALLGQGGQPFSDVVVLVNGVNATTDRPQEFVLDDGDEVAVFPPISGG